MWFKHSFATTVDVHTVETGGIGDLASSGDLNGARLGVW